MGRPRLGDLPYRCPLGGVGQPDAGIDETMGGGIATRPAEDEEDRGKHPLLGEALHGLDPIRALESAATASFQAEHVLDSWIGASPSLTLDKGREQVQGLCTHSVSDHVHRLEGHRTMVGGNETGRSPSLTHPCRKLLIVGHGRRKTYQLEILGSVDDHLLPDGAPGPVLEIVHLVQDHETDLVEPGSLGIDHVAKHLGRHDDDLGIPVDHVVPGQQSNPFRPVSGYEIREFLVGQCLDGSGVERALPP